ncbi:MAG: hypothetical protein ABIV50_14195 [Opitutus sp.]
METRASAVKNQDLTSSALLTKDTDEFFELTPVRGLEQAFRLFTAKAGLAFSVLPPEENWTAIRKDVAEQKARSVTRFIPERGITTESTVMLAMHVNLLAEYKKVIEARRSPPELQPSQKH